MYVQKTYLKYLPTYVLRRRKDGNDMQVAAAEMASLSHLQLIHRKRVTSKQKSMERKE